MSEMMSGTPLRPCACGQQLAGGGEMMLALTPSDLAELKSQIPNSADMDGDGTVDEHDIAALDAAIYGAFDKVKAATDAAAAESEPPPEPTLAEPQPTLAEPRPTPAELPPGFPVPPGPLR